MKADSVIVTTPPRGHASGPELESPFVDVLVSSGPEREAGSGELHPGRSYETVSPFLTAYESYSDAEVLTPVESELYGILSELRDEEFTEAIYELQSEILEQYLPHERPGLSDYEVEILFEQALSPLLREVDKMLEGMADEVDRHDLTSLQESEIDVILDRFEPSSEYLSPAFDQFLKKLWKKAKKAVKRTVKAVKSGVKRVGGAAWKGVKLVAKVALAPWTLVLKKLKRLVRPLLKRVLRVAINKLPEPLRPYATRLADRLFGRYLKTAPPSATADRGDSGTEPQDEPAAADGTGGEPAAEEIGYLQHEFDLGIAHLILTEDEGTQDLAITEYESAAAVNGSGSQEVLDRARERFVEDLQSLGEDEDPTPAVERFLPAVLPALRLGIRLVGRKRVVSALAKFLGRAIRRYVTPKMVKPLSTAIVDAGLKLITLETEEGSEERAAAMATAGAVEDTLRKMAEVSEELLEDEMVLEALAGEAFESSLAANYPPIPARPELHESELWGTWVRLPQRGPTVYKKYSKTPEATVTPAVAAKLRSFGDSPVTTLGRPLTDLAAAGPLRVTVHLYEAVKGTWLSKISLREKGVYGLGSTRSTAWGSIHPLTREAAALLLKEPGLGVNVPAKYLQSPHRIGVGQRFYYLEVTGLSHTPGKPPAPSPGDGVGLQPAKPKIQSQVNIALDFPKDEIVVGIYFDEEAAQEIAVRLRKKQPVDSAIASVKALMDAVTRSFIRDKANRHVRIGLETTEYAVPVVLGAIALKVLEKLLVALIVWVIKALAEYVFRKMAEAFIATTEDPGEGVTVVLAFVHPPGFTTLGTIIRASKLMLPRWPSFGMPHPRVELRAGFHRV